MQNKYKGFKIVASNKSDLVDKGLVSKRYSLVFQPRKPHHSKVGNMCTQ